MRRSGPDAMRRAFAFALVSAVLAAPIPALAAPGFAVCMGLDPAGQGRIVATAEPYARDSARVESDAPAFARAAAGQGKAQGSLEPACHWEPTRDKAADYLRRFRQGSGKKDAAEVAFAAQS